MVDITDTLGYGPVTRIETSDLVVGGTEASGPNLRLSQLASRDKALQDALGALVIGTNVQAWDEFLDALSAVTGTGLLFRTGDDPETIGLRQIGTHVQAHSAELAAIAALTGTGTLRRTGTAAWALSNPGAGFVSLEQALTPAVAQGRLSLQDQVSRPSSEITGATTLYYVPDIGTGVALYNTSSAQWELRIFSQLSLSLAGLAASTNYDIFIYDNAGTLTLEAVAWSNSGAGASSRATGLVFQDGIRVKSGALGRRYLGTIRTTSTAGQCEDSSKRAFVWNLQNQAAKNLKHQMLGVGRYSYTPQSWRAANNNATAEHRIEVVCGLSSTISAASGLVTEGSEPSATGIGTNSDAVNSADIWSNSAGVGRNLISASLRGQTSEGYNFYQMLEWGGPGNFFEGDYNATAGNENNGISGITAAWRY